MQPNTILKKRKCPFCETMTVGMWYTKRGRENRMCMKCGKTWEFNVKGDRDVNKTEGS